jgi:hypothetical protein
MSPGTLCPWAGTCLCLNRYLPADAGAGAGAWLMELQVLAGTLLYITTLEACGE